MRHTGHLADKSVTGRLSRPETQIKLDPAANTRHGGEVGGGETGSGGGLQQHEGIWGDMLELALEAGQGERSRVG